MRKWIYAISGILVLAIIFVIYDITYTPKIPQERINTAKVYCKKHNFNIEYAIFVDFGIHSGKYRFVLYDMKKRKIRIKSICSHGEGSANTPWNPKFSNTPGSYLSSLGHYKIGGHYCMKVGGGDSFLLYGLDNTNSNAFKRHILIHPFWNMDMGIFPIYLPFKKASLGCFAISHSAYQELRSLLDKSKRPVLLWAYCD